MRYSAGRNEEIVMKLKTFLNMSATVVIALGVALVLMQIEGTAQRQKGGWDSTGPYEVVPDWPKPLPDHGTEWTYGRTGAVWAESADRVYVVQTGDIPTLKSDDPLDNGGYASRPGRPGSPGRSALDIPGTRWENKFLVFNREGEMIENWKQHDHLFTHPHSLRISPYDPEKSIWVVDGRSPSGDPDIRAGAGPNREGASHTVYKFSRDGQLLMTLGEFGVPGDDEGHFGGPTDLAFFPNGDFIVGDGYRNGRVVRFDQDGNYLSEFGTRGSEPGQFQQVHGVAIDARGRIYVADRGNSRIQVFEQDGTLLDIWPNIPMPDHIQITGDGHLWVADGAAHRFMKYDLEGGLQDTWGSFGTQPGGFWVLHHFSVDEELNLYTAEVIGGRAQKFVPKPGADRSRLIDMFFGFVKPEAG